MQEKQDLDELLGIVPDMPYRLMCCGKDLVTGDGVETLDARACVHECCVITSCKFCRVDNGGWGPAACPCLCGELVEGTTPT
jgi:hypothetical protein